MTLYGWTISQWAEAAGWFNGDLPTPDLHGARLVRHHWHRSRASEPGENLLIMAERPMDFAWAISMIEAAATSLAIYR